MNSLDMLAIPNCRSLRPPIPRVSLRVSRKVLLRLFFVTTLAGFGFSNSVCGGEAEVKPASFAARAREIFAGAQKRHRAEPTNAVAAWEFAGEGKAPILNKEPLVFENVKLSQRSYK